MMLKNYSRNTTKKSFKIFKIQYEVISSYINLERKFKYLVKGIYSKS